MDCEGSCTTEGNGTVTVEDRGRQSGPEGSGVTIDTPRRRTIGLRADGFWTGADPRCRALG